VSEKPFCIHFNDRRKVLERLPKDAIVLDNRRDSWMIVRLPGMTWDQARDYFKDDALIGICEQKEYLANEKAEVEVEPHKVDAVLDAHGGGDKGPCGKRGCVV